MKMEKNNIELWMFCILASLMLICGTVLYMWSNTPPVFVVRFEMDNNSVESIKYISDFQKLDVEQQVNGSVVIPGTNLSCNRTVVRDGYLYCNIDNIE